MTEAHVGFLCNIASKICVSGSNRVETMLKSYYLMRCTEITNRYGLPKKHFSKQARCPQCCIEWKAGTEIKLRPIKLRQRQMQRKRRQKGSKAKQRRYCSSRKTLLSFNEVEKVCSFCNHSFVTRHKKPEKEPNKGTTAEEEIEDSDAESTEENEIKLTTNGTTKLKTEPKLSIKNKSKISIYSNAFDIFAINNKNNLVASAVKQTPKVIQNCKKKKDKFAGLCQKAVMASAKLKQENEKQNKLKLFLKPSMNK